MAEPRRAKMGDSFIASLPLMSAVGAAVTSVGIMAFYFIGEQLETTAVLKDELSQIAMESAKTSQEIIRFLQRQDALLEEQRLVLRDQDAELREFYQVVSQNQDLYQVLRSRIEVLELTIDRVNEQALQ